MTNLDETDLEFLKLTIRIHYPDLAFETNDNNDILVNDLFDELNKSCSKEKLKELCRVWRLRHNHQYSQNRWLPAQFLDIYEDIRERGAVI